MKATDQDRLTPKETMLIIFDFRYWHSCLACSVENSRGRRVGQNTWRIAVSYAIIQSGGRQFRVSPGEVVRVPNLDGEVGSNIEFGNILCIGGGDGGFKIGDGLSGAKVTGTVVSHGRARKVIVFKFKRRKQYKKTQGHRQGYTAVKIDSISA